MRNSTFIPSSSVVVAVSALLLAACGSGAGSGSAPKTNGFNPPAPSAGFTRLTALTVPGIPPGADETFCQYAMAPLDHDVDVVDVRSFQSKGGHHAVLFSYKDDGTQTIGKNVKCMGTEVSSGAGASQTNSLSSMGGFLGGGDTFPLPDGVAFRLKKGDGLMMKYHYINASGEPLDGDSVIDVKFAEIDPNRAIAALFVNVNVGFTLPAQTETNSSVDCVAQSDVQIIMMTNHMHEFGKSASTEVLRASTGATEMLHEDPKWAYDMQFNPTYSRWPVATPFILHAGDTIRTNCSWANTTDKSMTFPREMCIGTGFALATGTTPTVPSCAAGMWISAGI